MKLKSKINMISKRQKTVRTILPQTVIEMLDLRIDDYMEWIPEVRDNKVYFLVRKWEDDDDQTEKTNIKEEHKEKRPVITIRVSKALKDKILKVYGDYKPVEYILEHYFFKNKITPPSVIKDDDRRIRELNIIINDYNTIYKDNQKLLKRIEFKNNQIDKRIKRFKQEISDLKEKQKRINENVNLVNIENQDRLEHSINVVVNILTENKKLREQRPTKPVPKSVVKLYSDNCNMSLKKFMQYIPDNLHDCVSK